MRPRPIDIDQPMEVLEEDSELGDEFEMIEEQPVLHASVPSIEIPRVEIGFIRRLLSRVFSIFVLFFFLSKKVEMLSSRDSHRGSFRRPEALIAMEGETIPDVEYLVDGSDYEFLEKYNVMVGNSSPTKSGGSGSAKKKKKKEEGMSFEQFEALMTKLERSVWDAQEEAHAHERMAAEGEDMELPFKLTDTPCGVCFQRRKSRKNLIVSCDMCHNFAHCACAVFSIVEKKKRWRCQGCVDGMGFGKLPAPAVASRKPLACSLCPFGLEAGVMMRTIDKKQWVHPRCAFWMGASLLGRKTVLKAVKLSPDQQQAQYLQLQEGQCFICKRKNAGPLVKCDHVGCSQHFHVSCAPRKGCHLNVDNIYFVNRNMTAVASLATGNQASLFEEDLMPQSKKGKQAGLKSYKKYNEISVNVSQLCPTHAPKNALASLDSESIWSKMMDLVPTLLPAGTDPEAARALYNHWVDRRLENGKWGELPLLRSLEARRSAQRQEKKKRKKEQKRLSVPTGGLLHIPTDPVYHQMIQLRVEMDKARTIIDLVGRRERFKKQVVQHDADELGLEDWLGELDGEEEVDVAELSTDHDADGSAGTPRPPPPRPPSMVVALPRGLPPTRMDLPLARSRRRGKPRPVAKVADGGGSFLLQWPDDAKKEPLDEAELNALLALPEIEGDASSDDEEWAKAKLYKKKSKKKKKKKKLQQQQQLQFQQQQQQQYPHLLHQETLLAAFPMLLQSKLKKPKL